MVMVRIRVRAGVRLLSRGGLDVGLELELHL